MIRIFTALAVALGLWGAAPVQAATETIDVGTQINSYSGNTRGFYFVAPKDFAIIGLDLPTDASSETFDVAVLKFSELNAWDGPASTFTTEFLARDQSTAITGLSIRIKEGETVGILGSRGVSAINSYASQDYVSSILGESVTLRRLLMQSKLRTVDPGDASLLGTEEFDMGRILVSVAEVPLPAGGALLLVGLGGLAALRRRA